MRRTGRPGRAAAARRAPSPRAGGTNGGSRSAPNRIRCPAGASEGGYCPGGRWIPLSRRNVCRVPVRVGRGNRSRRRSQGWSGRFGCGEKNVGWFLSITGPLTGSLALVRVTSVPLCILTVWIRLGGIASHVVPSRNLVFYKRVCFCFF